MSGRDDKEPRLSHLDDSGEARMVDVGGKPATRREAEAEGFVHMGPETLRLLMQGELPKGEALGTARIAGILAAKRCDELIPLCHTLPLDSVEVHFEAQEKRLRIAAVARTTARTGVEMEALTAVSVAALAIYDMCKAVDRQMRIEGVRLLRKSGGKRDHTGD